MLMNDHHEKRSGRGCQSTASLLNTKKEPKSSTRKRLTEVTNTKKETGSGQHEKRSGSGQHEKETGSGQHEKGTGSGP